jgi:hypothetical protein
MNRQANKPLFKDKKGREWSAEILQDMIDALEAIYESFDTAAYYFRRG